MKPFSLTFKETQLFQMYKQILRRINKAKNLQDLSIFFVLFSFEELKEVIMNKLNVEIEKGQKSEDNTDFFAVQSKIRGMYLCTIPFDEILPMSVQSHMFSFLDHDSFENLPLLSRSFRYTFSSSPILFKKYTLKFFDFGDRTLGRPNSLDDFYRCNRERTRKNLKPKKLCVEHKSKQVMIGIFPPETCDEIIDSKENDNVNAVDRLGQFPWHGIRKWYIDGIQFQILRFNFSQRPVSLYRSLFDSSSDTNWRLIVSGWKKFIENEKDPFQICDLSNFKDSIGTNHGCIYYPSFLQFEQTSKYTQQRQMKFIEINSYPFYIPSCITAKNFCDYISNRPLLCTSHDTLIDKRVQDFPHINQKSFFQNKDWKGSEKDLCEYILSLNKIPVSKESEKKIEIDSSTTDDIIEFDNQTTSEFAHIERVEYFYESILYLREWLESLYGTSGKFQFGQRSFTKFEIEINGGKITRVIHKDENEKPKKDNRNSDTDWILSSSNYNYSNNNDNCGWSFGSSNNNNCDWPFSSSICSDNNDDNDNISFDMYTWDDVQMGDEF
ncbi:hypothetical protein RFI_17446, partial [Reticulomyxa filosa]